MKFFYFLFMRLPTAIIQYFSSYLHHKCFFRLKSCSKFWKNLQIEPTLGTINVSKDTNLQQLLGWQPKSITSEHSMDLEDHDVESITKIHAPRIEGLRHLVNLRELSGLKKPTDMRMLNLIKLDCSNMHIDNLVHWLPPTITDLTIGQVHIPDLKDIKLKRLSLYMLTPHISKLVGLESLAFELCEDNVILPKSVHTLKMPCHEHLHQISMMHVRSLDLTSTWFHKCQIRDYVPFIKHIDDLRITLTANYIDDDFPECLYSKIVKLTTDSYNFEEIENMYNLEELNIHYENRCKFVIKCGKSRFPWWPKLDQINVELRSVHHQIFDIVDYLEDEDLPSNNNPSLPVPKVDYIVETENYDVIGKFYTLVGHNSQLFDMVLIQQN